MKTTVRQRRRSGSFLAETLLAMALLAVVIPSVGLAVSSATGDAARVRAESRSHWMVGLCLTELRASRAGVSKYFPTTRAGEVIPGAGDRWVLGFGGDGKLLGRVPGDAYAAGVCELAGASCRYLATLDVAPAPGEAAVMEVHLVIEWPAQAAVGSRQRLDFNTLLP